MRAQSHARKAGPGLLNLLQTDDGASLLDEFLHSTAPDISHVDGAILADGEVMTDVNLPVIVAVAAPTVQHLTAEIETQDSAVVRWCRLLIAAIHHIGKTIRPDSDGERLAQFVALPRGEKLSIMIKNLNSSIFSIRDIDAALGVN